MEKFVKTEQKKRSPKEIAEYNRKEIEVMRRLGMRGEDGEKMQKFAEKYQAVLKNNEKEIARARAISEEEELRYLQRAMEIEMSEK